MTLPELAKIAVETYIKEGKVISPPDNLPKEFLNKKAGVFVTIEKKNELRGLPRSEPQILLRGCVGTYLPTQKNIAEEIIQNAIATASEDYRFEPMTPEELPYLSYTIYILSQPKPVKNVKELNPKKFGIIVKTLNPSLKCGLLLPDLNGIDTVEQQIQICCQKGGIDKEKEKFTIFRFTVEKYEDKQQQKNN